MMFLILFMYNIMEANKISDKRLLAGFSLVSLVAMGIGFYRVWRGGDDLTSR
jgi:hypothetical protein